MIRRLRDGEANVGADVEDGAVDLAVLLLDLAEQGDDLVLLNHGLLPDRFTINK